jgi:hypothetical protein
MSRYQNTDRVVATQGVSLSSARAFTFTEVLVVAATIALLIALRLPFLTNAGPSATRAVCDGRMEHETRAVPSCRETEGERQVCRRPYRAWGQAQAEAIELAYLAPGSTVRTEADVPG